MTAIKKIMDWIDREISQYEDAYKYYGEKKVFKKYVERLTEVKHKLIEFAKEDLEDIKSSRKLLSPKEYVETSGLYIKKSEVQAKLEEFEEQLINNLGWNKPEHHLLRGQLGRKFSILKSELGVSGGVEPLSREAV